MEIQENIPLKPKTTLKIGGNARYFAELKSKEDCKEAHDFAKDKNIPLVVLGAGSNTVFADGVIEALVVKITADDTETDGNKVIVSSGKYLAVLINELAEKGLDLSPLTGIPGTIGGAIFGNAGQGYGGTWINSFVESVVTYEWTEYRARPDDPIGQGRWITLSKDDCGFGYRTSAFKKNKTLIWSVTLNVPSKPSEEIQIAIDRILKKRIETQPHKYTSGSCFLSKDRETPAWKLIDSAGLRGKQIGGIKVSDKHANFLINEGDANYVDAKEMVDTIKNTVSEEMSVEMRFIEKDGNTAY